MQEKYISIIIPVYNCEKYLSRCLDSVLNQTYNRLEIILINDGSTDSSELICKKYAEKDIRIKYVEQENHGVAYTRKKGIQIATGDYIGFVDADDYIDKDMYQQMVKYMSDADLVTSGYYLEEKCIFGHIPQGLYKTEEEIKYIYENMFYFKDTKNIGLYPNLWSKLFLTEKIKKTVKTLPMDVFVGEDADIVYKYVLLCDSIYISSICAYHHEVNTESLMNTVNKNYLQNVNCLYLSLEKELKKSAYKKILLPKLEMWIWQMVESAPQFMGFNLEKKNPCIRYLNPFLNLLKGKEVILYGAGAVGKDYYKLYKKTQDMKLVLWVDSNCENLQKEGLPVQSVEQILLTGYDYILIAVKEKYKAKEICKQLQNLGIHSFDILWKEPIQLDK